ncbi:MAG: hypothetical protein Q8P92_01465 [Candidatus Daviesbacteria bacterium]|nr:hypothetical protein [Candidatus Daviesbacteria bacterium]
MTYRKFIIEKKYYQELSISERQILKILEEVVKEVGEIYRLQLKDGFYPKDITKQELEKANKNNPEILSPFTYVKRENGQLKAIPYHKLYEAKLKPLASKIEKAAAFCENRFFKNYLLARAKSLLDGSYREADITWLDVKNSKIDFSIGPFERYLDKILFIKRVFQGHVGIINKNLTIQAEKIKETLYSSAKLSYEKYHSTDIPKKGVNVFVEQTPVTAGYMSDVVFSGEHFPSDLEIMQQYGSRILIYESQLKYKFDKLHYPIFKILFERRFASKYSKELLYKATGWTILLYELGRQLHKFSSARERLKELYGPIDEANGFASGIQHAKHLVVKGLILQDELEAIMIIQITWMFVDWLLNLKQQKMFNYVAGDTILLNAYLKSGALREYGGISWPNFSKIFFEIEAVADQLVYLLQKGSFKEAERFIKKHTTLENFESLGRNLKLITPNI